MPKPEEAPQATLDTICGGAVKEVFERELNDVLKNIADINTEAEKKRSISIEVTFKPFEDRTGAHIEFSCKSRIAPVVSVKSRIYLTRRDGRLIAVPHDPQPNLFTQTEQPDPAKVTEFPSAASQSA